MVNKRSRNSHPKLKQKRLDVIDYYITIGIHVVALVVNGGGLVWDFLYLSEGGESMFVYKGFAGKFKYLTFWSQIIQTLYFGLALVNDVVGSSISATGRSSKRTQLQKLRDLLHAGVIFPMGTFVVLTFWGIYAVDRELVFPKMLDAIIPGWLNHIMHTTVIVFLLLEKLFVYHWYPSRSTGLKYCLGFAAVYQAWILFIAWYADIWVYPILQVLSLPFRVVFFAVLWVVLILIYLSGEWLTEFLWGPQKAAKAEKVAAKKAQ